MRKIKYKAGRKSTPWNIEYTGKHLEIKTDIQLFAYNNDTLVECMDPMFSKLLNNVDLNKINWINVHGLNEIEPIQHIAEFFKIDNFILGDILNTTKRTKVEEYNDVLFFNIKSLLPNENSDIIQTEQISFLLKNNVLVSFQEKRNDFFKHVRERIRTHSGIVREKKADYLLYILLDSIIENFYITLENLENKLEALVDFSKTSTDDNVLLKIEDFRDNFNFLKKSIVPLKESLYTIKSTKDDNVFNSIEPENYSFFDRLNQKTLELLEQIDYDLTTLETVSNFYFSNQSHKMNQVMKTLTIVSAIFMPLTFIAGVYGMNFKNMPELEYRYGYFEVLGAMVLLTLIMVIYFKHKKWF